MLKIGQKRMRITRISYDKSVELYKQATKAVKYELDGKLLNVVFESGNSLVTVLIKPELEEGRYITKVPRSTMRADYFECKDLECGRTRLK